MPSFKMKGRITAIAPVEERGEKKFKVGGFTIDNEEKYNNLIQFDTKGEKADIALPLKVGQSVEVTFWIEQREYNGKRYTSLTAGAVVLDATEKPAPKTEPQTVNANGAAPELPVQEGDLLF